MHQVSLKFSIQFWVEGVIWFVTMKDSGICRKQDDGTGLLLILKGEGPQLFYFGQVPSLLAADPFFLRVQSKLQLQTMNFCPRGCQQY